MVDSSDCFSQHETDVNGFDFGTTFFGNTMEDCVGYQHLCVCMWGGGGGGYDSARMYILNFFSEYMTTPTHLI